MSTSADHGEPASPPEPPTDPAPTLPLDLRTDPLARRAVRLPVSVLVEFAGAPGVLVTLEGPVSYQRGDALVTSDAGERWPVTREVFERSYEAEAADTAGMPGPAPQSVESAGAIQAPRYRKRQMPVLARRMDHAFEVRVGSGQDPIRGQPGDWLLQYEPGRHGIVAAERFAQTYRVD